MTITVAMQETKQYRCDNTPHEPGDPHCPCRLAFQPADNEPAVNELTDRERQVLLLLGSGLPNRNLARQLGIAERTVKAHVAHIIKKLGLRTRLEAAVVANLHHDLICPGKSMHGR
ncbi:LuxR C-terminal-related transcriptional regulator [Streptomyces sp. NPDC019990]|uniref:response regulator transcription factor n=1 Tax=Streptomyces sp. NPDC019990 TaxID=3154693 RepID=UPI00340D9E80